MKTDVLKSGISLSKKIVMLTCRTGLAEKAYLIQVTSIAF